MNNKDVKVGMRVVPFQKTVEGWVSLDESVEVQIAREKRQSFLYVVAWDDDGYWILAQNLELSGQVDRGDFFNAQDFVPYVSL